MKAFKVLFVNEVKLSGYQHITDYKSEVKQAGFENDRIKEILVEGQYVKIVDLKGGVTLVPMVNVRCIFADPESVAASPKINEQAKK